MLISHSLYLLQLAELKRVNRLIMEQDFFALRLIRVPVKKHGIISERLEHSYLGRTLPNLEAPPVSSREYNHEDGSLVDAPCDEAGETSSLLVRTLSIRDTCNRQSTEAREFLQRMDGDLEKIRFSTNSYKSSLDEVSATLTCKRIHPLRDGAFCNEADCGIRWWNLVIWMIIVVLLIPSLYFLYFEFGYPP